MQVCNTYTWLSNFSASFDLEVSLVFSVLFWPRERKIKPKYACYVLFHLRPAIQYSDITNTKP